MMVQRLGGEMRIVETIQAVKDGPPVTRWRSWRVRLWSWPWRPWVATWTEIPKLPAAYITGNTIVAHPAVVAELKRIEQQRERIDRGGR